MEPDGSLPCSQNPAICPWTICYPYAMRTLKSIQFCETRCLLLRFLKPSCILKSNFCLKKGKVYPLIGRDDPENAIDGESGQRHSPAALPPGKGPVAHCTGGWVGLMAGVDGCRRSRPYRNSIPGSSSPKRVVILTELSPRITIFSHVWLYIPLF